MKTDKKNKRSRYYHIALVLLIILLATLLRVQKLDLFEFKSDEALVLIKARQAVLEGHIPLTGLKASQGPHHGPWLIYLMLPPALLSGDPVLFVIYIIIWNITSLILLYILVRRYFGDNAAIFTLKPVRGICPSRTA